MTTVSDQNINLIPSVPKLHDWAMYLLKTLKIELNSHHIGTIQSFDPSNQTAQVRINYTKTKTVSDNFVQKTALIEYPIVTGVPVICIGGGGDGYLTFPIAQGDECILLFNDRDIDNWFAGSQSSPPNTARLHAFNDAIALVGLRSLPNVIGDYDSVRAVLKKGDALVGVGAGDGSLVKIANDSLTMNGILQSLMTQLENLSTQLNTLATDIALITVICATPGNPSSVPVNAAAFTSIATNINTIKTNLTSIAADMGDLLE